MNLGQIRTLGHILTIIVILFAAMSLTIVSVGAAGGQTDVTALDGDRTVLMTQSGGYAQITDEDPPRGSTLSSNEDATITFTVDYDTGGEEPGYISVSFGEDQYEQPHKEINIDQMSGTKEITVTQPVHSTWDQAVVDVHVWPESDGDYNFEIDSDNINYEVDGSEGSGGELPTAEIDCEINIVEGESFACFGHNSEAPSGYITEYQWEFDRNIRYGESADFTAKDQGIMTVYLTVTDNEGNTDTTTENIDIEEANTPPVGDISCDETVTVGETVHCDASDTSDTNDNIEKYEWSFGNDDSAFGVEATNVFTEPGTYNIELQVTDAEGESDTTSQTITVEDQSPVVEQITTSESTVRAGSDVEIAASVSDPLERDIGMTYNWDVNGEMHQGTSTAITLREVGVQEITLTVKNEYGTPTTKTETVTVTNVAPSIEITKRDSIGTTSAESFPVTVENPSTETTDVIMFVDGDEVDRQHVTAHSDTVQLTHQFAPGSKSIKIEARDEHGGTDSESFNVNVGGEAPEIEKYSPEKLQRSVSTGETLDFSVTADNPEVQPVNINWYIGNERVKTDSQTLSKTFTEHGFYPVEAVITDEYGFESSQKWQIQADTFSESPRIEDHSTAEQLDTDRNINVLTFSFRNPEANERTANIEIRATNPSGINIVEGRNIDETDQAQSAVVRTVAPGSQEELSLGVSVSDQSLIGEEVKISYEVLYYPEDAPDVSVQVFEDSLNLYVDQDKSGEIGLNSENTDDETPGFGVLTAFTSIILIVARQVLTDNENR